MKKIALFTLFALTACQSFSDVEQLRPYSCNWRDAGVDECPTGWRCGYDNRCFNPAVPVGLKTCKFTQDCFDGYRCSADNACFNPAIEEARACREDADCASAWRCGIGKVCQNTKVGAAYPCTVDSNCEQGWRCDVLANVCADVDDTLFGEDRPLTQTLIHPLLQGGAPAQIAVGVSAEVTQSSYRYFVSVFDAGVRVIGEPRDNSAPYFKTWPLPGPIETIAQVAVAGDHILFRMRSAELLTLELDGGYLSIANGIDTIRQFDPNPETTRLDRNAEALMVVSQNRVIPVDAFLQPDAGNRNNDAGAAILDVAAAGQNIFTLRETGVVSEELGRTLGGCQGLFFPSSERTRYPDGSEQTCNDGRNRPQLEVVVRLDGGVQYQLLATGNSSQYGFAVVSTFPSGLTLASIALFTDNNGSQITAPQPVCPNNERPLQITVTTQGTNSNDQHASLVVRCPSTNIDGGFVPNATWIVQNGNSNDAPNKFAITSDDEPQWSQGVVACQTTSNVRAHAGRNGLFWFDQFTADGTRLPTPFELDRIPGAILRIEAPNQSNIAVLTDTFMYQHVQGIGLISQGDSFAEQNADFVPRGAILGQPNWEITREGVIDLANFPLNADQPRFVVRIATTTAELTTPASGQLQTLPDGKRLLVIFSGERLLTADITDVEHNPYLSPAVLEVRLVPSAGVHMRGLAIDGQPRQPADAGVSNIATGFLLTDSELFAFAAVTQTRWSLTPVPLPERFGVPLQLWSENGRARLAFERGTVLTLPERVPITTDMPATDAGVVSAFARLCGTTYAIRGDGLYRSVLSDAGSTWSPLPLPTVPADERQGAAFFETEGSIFLATTTGRIAELSLGFNDAGLPMCP